MTDPSDKKMIDMLCELVGRLVLEVGQHQNPQIVADLDMRLFQQRAAIHSRLAV